MEADEIIKNNQLIAEFMKYDDVDCHNCKYSHSCNWRQCSLTKNEEAELLRYHVSWSKLMPVVEKIESLDLKGYNIKVCIDTVRCFILVSCPLKGTIKLFYRNIYNDSDSKIIRIYKVITEFIKWYDVWKN